MERTSPKDVREEAEDRLGLPRGSLDELREELNQIVFNWVDKHFQEATPSSARKRKRADLEEASLAGWRDLWEHRRFPDAVVHCRDSSFEVHRAVLGTRSPVFNRMFGQEGLREGCERRLTIDDAEPETVEAMLRYMYVGEVEEDCQFTDLLALADRYEVDGLVKICADAILQTVSSDTVVGSLCALRTHLCSDVVQEAYEKLLLSIQNDRQLLREVAAAVRGPKSSLDGDCSPG